ncbi:hypothetical protein, partial [Cellulomonas septica]
MDSKDSGTQTVTPVEGARTLAPAGTIPTQRSRAGGGPHGGRSRRTWFVVAGGLALVLAGATTG